MYSERDRFGKCVVMLAVLLLLSFGASAVLAQTTTGKITGRVTDAKTKEALPGVSVSIVGTKMGAVTDARGEYVILGVSPGDYKLKVTIVGYAAQEIPVLASVDRTTTANVVMSVEAIQMGAVEVSAQRPLVEKEVSFTQQIMDSKLVKAIPTGSARIQHAIMTQVGTDRDGWGVVIRGNSDRDIAFIQDGLRFQQRFDTRTFSSYPTSSVQEIQVLTGGFAPEYGNVRAGVVNIVSKEPSRWLVSGEARYITAGNHFYGDNPFSENYWNAKRWLSMDPSGDTNQDGRQDFEGWKAWLARTSAAKQNVYLGQTVTTAEQGRGIWLYQHRRVKEDGTVLLVDGTTLSQKDPQGLLNMIGKDGDYGYSYDATVGGPLIKDKVAATYSIRRERTPIYNAAQPSFLQTIHQGKLMFTPTTSTKLTLMGLSAVSDGTGFGRGTDAGNSIGGNANGVGGGSGDPPSTSWRNKMSTNMSRLTQWQLGATWRQVLSPKSFYEASFTRQRFQIKARFQPIVDNRLVVAVFPDGKIELSPEIAKGAPTSRLAVARNTINSLSPIYADNDARKAWAAAAQAKGAVVIGNDPNGWVYPEANPDLLVGVGDLGQGGRNQDSSHSNQVDFNTSLTTQLLRNHQVKLGTSLQVADMFQASGTILGHEMLTVANRRQWSGSFYAQDKMEYRQLIVNAGARIEWDRYDKHYDFHAWRPTDPNAAWIWLNPVKGGYDPELYTYDKAAKTVRPPMKFYFAPRLGMSYPITETAKLYFNYGYFYRPPSMREMYELYISDLQRPTYNGNPYADALRTIQYELGYEQGFFANKPYAFKLSGDVYFKDSNRDQFTYWYAFGQGLSGGPSWQPGQSQLMRDIRGVEMSVQKARGKYWSGYVGYDFNLQRPDNATWQTLSFDANEPTYNKIFTANTATKAAESEARPILRMNVNVHSPAELSKNPVKGGWEMDLYYFRKRGAGFNFNPNNDPLLVGKLNKRWIAERYLNLRVSKEIHVRGVRPQFYLDVNNLFDWAYPNGTGNIFGFPTGMNYPLGAATTTVQDFNAYMAEIDRRGMTPGEWIGDPGSADFNKFMPIYWWGRYTNKRRMYFGVRFDM
ncbi:MAG: TonB-dependent receptor [Candidatus Latescibacteria bacterium]|nr:TonB-dependent receptor [Candidatus Latescibacterota bacterium]